MSKFTPGPWEADKRVRTWGIFQAGKVPNCYVDADKICSISPARVDGDDKYNFSGTDEQNANARLIAAAPTAYELLKEMEWGGGHDEFDGMCLECKMVSSTGHASNCALAKYFRAVEGE